MTTTTAPITPPTYDEIGASYAVARKLEGIARDRQVVTPVRPLVIMAHGGQRVALNPGDRLYVASVSNAGQRGQELGLEVAGYGRLHYASAGLFAVTA